MTNRSPSRRLRLWTMLAPPPHRIDEAHFQLITEGMTGAEVEAIFGVPARSRSGRWSCSVLGSSQHAGLNHPLKMALDLLRKAPSGNQ
jgi:hypothetical protein